MYQKEIVVTHMRDFRENLFLLKIMTPWKQKDIEKALLFSFSVISDSFVTPWNIFVTESLSCVQLFVTPLNAAL